MTRSMTIVVLAVGGLLTLGGCGLDSAATAPQEAASSATAAPSEGPSEVTTEPSKSAKTPPVVTRRTVTETRAIPYATRSVADPGLARGTTKVRTRGRAGVRTLTYEVTLADGVPTKKRLVRQVVTRRPVTRVIAVGTKTVRQCDPNYSGACVPIAGDVDCAGGSGNGPAYVQGPVRVVGSDIYDLDRDGDGVGCD